MNSDLIAPRTLKYLLAGSLGLTLAIKFYLALNLDLYSDEIFYWQASRHPSLAYSDLPFLTALLAGLGSSLAPATPFTVRLPFLLLGGMLPALVYWLARPLAGRIEALQAAALSLCIPLGGFLGLLAVPDVPLVFLGLLSIGFFERALRTGNLLFWLALGASTALGLSTHYRFALYVAGALLFLSATPGGRQCWRLPGLWMAGVIGAAGLVPAVAFNLNHDLAGLGFHLLQRHPWSFQGTGMLHVFKQAGLVTPPLYALLLASLWHCLKAARAGDRTAALLACVACTNLLTFLVLAPWTDSTSTSIHWPLSGYFPLLVYAPGTLRALQEWLTRRLSRPLARRLTLAIPVLGFGGTLIALFGVGSQAFTTALQPLLGSGILSTKMVGWPALVQHADELAQREFDTAGLIVATDNYYTLAQLEFGLTGELSGFTLDTDKAARDGRLAQYVIWGKDKAGLMAKTGHDALFITEDSSLTIPDKQRVLRDACEAAGRVEFLEQLAILDGAKSYSFYRLRGLGVRDDSSPCPFPSLGWIDRPVAGESIGDYLVIDGWVFNEDIGVEEVNLLIDGERAGRVTYGKSRPDVVEIMEVDSDPNRPALGFSMEYDASDLAPGRHVMELEFVNGAGERQFYGTREFRVRR